MTSKDAAAYLGITVQRIHQLAEAGAIERRRVGYFWLYPKHSLDKWKKTPKGKGGRPRKTEAKPEE